nr:hypothetical protein [Tanacetum cinerariifolium]
MIAYLEKTKSNAEFHQIVDFLTSSSIYHALTMLRLFIRRDDSLVRAATTACLDAQQDSAMAQVRPKGASIQSIDPPLSTGHTVRSGEDMIEHEIVLTDPVPQTSHDSPLSGVHTPGSDEGSMTLNELTDL